jgi:hypothetical protein
MATQKSRHVSLLMIATLLIEVESRHLSILCHSFRLPFYPAIELHD